MPVKTGDVVKIIFDRIHGKVDFMVNDHDLDTAFYGEQFT